MRRHTATGHQPALGGGGLVLALALTLLVDCSGAPAPKNAGRGDPGATLPAAVPGSHAGDAESAPQGADGERADEAPEAALQIAPTPAPTHPPVPQSANDTDATGDATSVTRPSTPEDRESLARRAETDDTLIVIDQPEAPHATSLAEAAHKAREERGKAPRSKIVITDENLAEYATGELTVAAPQISTASEEESDGIASEDLGRNEEHWRQGARELRLKLRRAWDEARILEEQVAGLRVRFYAEDDPHIRDSEIKPAWDRALERQRQAEEDVRAYRRELDQFLEDGRRAGALPGWLRDGIEYEPEIEDEETGEDDEALEGFGRLEPEEPERMENPSRPPG